MACTEHRCLYQLRLVCVELLNTDVQLFVTFIQRWTEKWEKLGRNLRSCIEIILFSSCKMCLLFSGGYFNFLLVLLFLLRDSFHKVKEYHSSMCPVNLYTEQLTLFSLPNLNTIAPFVNFDSDSPSTNGFFLNYQDFSRLYPPRPSTMALLLKSFQLYASSPSTFNNQP